MLTLLLAALVGVVYVPSVFAQTFPLPTDGDSSNTPGGGAPVSGSVPVSGPDTDSNSGSGYTPPGVSTYGTDSNSNPTTVQTGSAGTEDDGTLNQSGSGGNNNAPAQGSQGSQDSDFGTSNNSGSNFSFGQHAVTNTVWNSFVDNMFFTFDEAAAMFYNVLFPVGIALGILAIITAGYAFLTSQGQPDRVKDAREKLTSAVVGILFIVLSLVILRVIIGTLFGQPGF